MQSTLKKITIPAEFGYRGVSRNPSSSSSSRSSSSTSWSCDCICPGDDCSVCPDECTPNSFLVSIRNVLNLDDEPLYINCATYCIIQDTTNSCRWYLEDPDEYISLIELMVSSTSGATLTVKDPDGLLIFQDRIPIGEFNCGDIPTLFSDNAADCDRVDSSAQCGFATISPCCDCYDDLFSN